MIALLDKYFSDSATHVSRADVCYGLDGHGSTPQFGFVCVECSEVGNFGGFGGCMEFVRVKLPLLQLL